MLHIGDKLVIIDHEEGNCGTNCSTFVNEVEEGGAQLPMSHYIGDIVTVSSVMSNGNVRIEEDDGIYNWSPCMFTLLECNHPKEKKVEPKKLPTSDKIPAFDYRGIIDKVGIEFEGFYNRDKRDELDAYDDDNILRGHDDGSLDYNRLSSNKWYDREYITPALKEKKLQQTLNMMDYYFKNKDYRLNDSCGLHFHLSFKNKVNYAQVCNADFFYKVVEMFKREFPAVYNQRKDNTYARTRYSLNNYHDEDDFLKHHFRKTSKTRYYAVNYCYDEHKTIEIRFYGGTYATIEGLAKAIQNVIDLVAVKCKEKQTIKREVAQPDEPERYNQPLNFRIFKSTPSEQTIIRHTGAPIDLNEVITRKVGNTMYLDLHNSRYYTVKKNLSEDYKEKNGWIWDIIWGMFRNTPLDPFADMVKTRGKELTLDFIFDQLVYEVKKLADNYGRKAVEDHLVKNRISWSIYTDEAKTKKIQVQYL